MPWCAQHWRQRWPYHSELDLLPRSLDDTTLSAQRVAIDHVRSPHRSFRLHWIGSSQVLPNEGQHLEEYSDDCIFHWLSLILSVHCTEWRWGDARQNRRRRRLRRKRIALLACLRVWVTIVIFWPAYWFIELPSKGCSSWMAPDWYTDTYIRQTGSYQQFKCALTLICISGILIVDDSQPWRHFPVQRISRGSKPLANWERECPAVLPGECSTILWNSKPFHYSCLSCDLTASASSSSFNASKVWTCGSDNQSDTNRLINGDRFSWSSSFWSKCRLFVGKSLWLAIHQHNFIVIRLNHNLEYYLGEN